ncbi:hypothetical protein LV779_30885 [Streptomyces thinghirensis]|nr:hypothetical protein [Streptomyces thinghirensis]
MSIVNIDVTLRDGGYRNSFHFPLDYALKHAKLTVEAGFDWVEIAYRRDRSCRSPTSASPAAATTSSSARWPTRSGRTGSR